MTPKQILLFTIGPIGGALLGLVTIPVITWFFSQEDVGRMAMFQVTLSFSTLLFTLGLDQAYVREFHETDNQPALLKNVMVPGILLLIVSLIVVLAMGDTLATWLFEVPEALFSVLVAIALLATFISRFFSLVLRMNERGLAFSLSQVLPKSLLLGIVGAYVLFGAEKNLKNLIAANTAAIVSVCIVFAWNTRKEWVTGLQAKIDFAQIKKLLRFGMPLTLGGLAFWGLTATDKVFLRILSDYNELGIYSVSVSFAAAATMLQNVFSTVWAPTVYKWASSGKELENVYRVSRYVLALVVLFFSLVGLFSWVVPFLLPANYRPVQWILVSCVGYPLLYTLSETTVVGIGISRRSSFSMLASILALVVNLIGNWLLIPVFGAAGAAVSTCISFWIFFILRTEFSMHLWQGMPRKILYVYTTTIVAGAVISTLWGDSLGYLVFLFWALVLLFGFQTFRRELKEARSFIAQRL